MMNVLQNGILSITITMSPVILIMLAASKLLGSKFTAGCRYLLWTIIIIRMAIPLGGVLIPSPMTIELPEEIILQSGEDEASVITTPVSDIISTPPLHAGGVGGDYSSYQNNGTQSGYPQLSADTASQPERGADTYVPGSAAINSSADESGDKQSPASLRTEDIFRLVFIVYAVTAAFVFTLRIALYIRYAMQLSRCRVPCTDDGLKRKYAGLCARLKLKRVPGLYICSRVASPMVYGFITPAVILPESYDRLTALEEIITHELVHYKRGDLILKLTAQLALALNWFNPLVYIAVEKFSQAAELSCDEIVLRDCEMSSRLDYGSSMLEIIRGIGNERHIDGAGLTTKFNPSARAVKERFRCIVDTKGKKRGIWLIALLLLLSLFAGALVACGWNSGEDADITNDADKAETPESDSVKPVASQAGEDDNYNRDYVYSAYLTAAMNESPTGEPALSGRKLDEILNRAHQLYPDGKLYVHSISPEGDILLSVSGEEESSFSLKYNMAGDELERLEELPEISNLVLHSGELDSGCYSTLLALESGEAGEAGTDRLYVKNDRLYVITISGVSCELPINPSGLDIDAIKNSFTFTGNDAASIIAFRGADIGGLEEYAYIFIFNNGTQQLRAAALRAPDNRCENIGAGFYGSLPYLYVVGSDASIGVNQYYSYPVGERWVMNDPESDDSITLYYSDAVNSFYTSADDINTTILLDILNRDERSEYSDTPETTQCSVRFEFDDGREMTLYQNDILTDNTGAYQLSAGKYGELAAFANMITRRSSLTGEWSYIVPLGSAASDKEFERLTLSLNFTEALLSVYGDGDYNSFESICFSGDGVRLTLSDTESAFAAGLMERLRSAESGEIQLRDVAMLFVDGNELPLDFSIATTDNTTALIFSTGENPVSYSSVARSITFTLGDTVTYLSSPEELLNYDYTPDNPVYRYHEAMLSPRDNIVLLEELSIVEPGTYASYESLTLGEQSYELVRINEYVRMLCWRVEVLESEVDGIAPGVHYYIPEEGISGVTLREVVKADTATGFRHALPDNPELAEAAAALIEQAKGAPLYNSFINNWFNTCGIYEIPEYGEWDEAAKSNSSIYIAVFDYLTCRYGALTEEEVDSFGREVFGIENLFAKTGIAKNDYNRRGDKWMMPGHGGEVWAYDILDISYDEQGCRVTLLFWADFSKTVKSHIIEYRTGEDMTGSPVKNIGCDYVETSIYPPAHISA